MPDLERVRQELRERDEEIETADPPQVEPDEEESEED